MPELILFGVARSVILEKDDNSISFVTMLTAFDIEVNSLQASDGTLVHALPSNAALSIEWVAAAIWKISPDDWDKTFEQKIEVFFPDGSQAGGGAEPGVTIFQPTNEITYSVRNAGIGFPIGLTGEYSIRLYLREMGSRDWIEKGDYPVIIRHVNLSLHGAETRL